MRRLGRPHAARPRHLACRARRPDRRHRRQRLGQDPPAAAAGRRAAARRPAGCTIGQTVQAGLPVPGRRASCPSDAAGDRGGAARCARTRRARTASSCPPASWPSGSASRNERQWTPVADLSGGERRRLQLLRLLLGQPNVLLLDEPTNDLDTDTLAELEDLLDSWAGHAGRRQPRPLPDRAGLRLDGGAARRRLAGSAARRHRRVPGPARQPRSEAGRGDSGTPNAQGDSRAARKELARLERAIAQLERARRRCTTSWPSTPPTTRGSAELDAELREVVAEREAAEEEWLTLADE